MAASWRRVRSEWNRARARGKNRPRREIRKGGIGARSPALL